MVKINTKLLTKCDDYALKMKLRGFNVNAVDFHILLEIIQFRFTLSPVLTDVADYLGRHINTKFIRCI